jgi:hypothetical protein
MQSITRKLLETGLDPHGIKPFGKQVWSVCGWWLRMKETVGDDHGRWV